MNKLENKRIKNAYIISQCLKSLNIHHIVTDGALLGFIREKGLIEWDWDFEISIRYIDFKRNLIKIIESFDKLKIGRVSFNNSYENPKLTIFQHDYKYCLNAFHYSKDKKVIYRKMYKFPSKFLDEISIIKINGFDFPIPKNAEDLLELEYGENWRIPLKSFDKNEYKSINVYTKKNNKLFNKVNRYIKLTDHIFKKFKYIIKNFLSKYPIFEYLINQSREQLFIDQLAHICKTKLNVILIEIGSSDLKEALILSRINKKNNFPVKVFEASNSTYKNLIKLKDKFGLNNVEIFNKAVVPSLLNYKLKENKSPNLNEMILSNNNVKNKSKNILLSNIKELKIEAVHKLVKMDIEGLEENLISENLQFLKTLNNISFSIEMHQSKYKNNLLFEKVVCDLLNHQYSLLFIELSRGCNKDLKNLIKNRSLIFKKVSGRFLVKNPPSACIEYIFNTDYRLMKNYPYFSKRNIRSITLTKSI